MTRKIVNHYGKNHQLMVAIEEMSELIKEISKDYRGNLDREHLIEEIADVKIMLRQLVYIYDISHEELQIIMEKKINRTLEHIELADEIKESDKQIFCATGIKNELL